MTDSQSATESITAAEIHNAALATYKTKKEQIRYACDQLGNPSTSEVIEWLGRYGVRTSRPTTSTVVNEWKRERGLHDTGTLPRLSDDVLAELDREVGRADPAGWAPLESSPPAPATEHALPDPERPDVSAVPVYGPADRAANSEADTTEHLTGGSEHDVPLSPVSATTVATEPGDSSEHPTAEPVVFASIERTPVGADSEHEQGSEHVSVTVADTGTDAAVRPPEQRTNAPLTPAEQLPVSPFMEVSEPAKKETPPGAWAFYVVSVMSLLVSLDTSWEFFGDRLHIENLWIRGGMFAVLEAALIACGIGMAAGVRRHKSPGAPQLSAWILCGVSAWMAISVSGAVDGPARVMLGPVLGMIMFHHALGIEKRAHAERSRIWARIARELRERVLSRVGLSDDERDAARRTRDRAARRAARLSLGRHVMFREARLARALSAANVAHDDTMRSVMLAELAARRHSGQLATLQQKSPWTEHSEQA